MKDISKILHSLNAKDKSERFLALESLRKEIESGKFPLKGAGEDVNNHIHTTYSFSPYSPAMAVYKAYEAGLLTAGLMDHDSVSGAEEFFVAGEVLRIMSTVGVECRVKMSGTKIAEKRINNPDQKGIAYVAIHGIPRQNIGRVSEFFRPYSEFRLSRNRDMTAKINEIMAEFDISIDFESDVLPLSMNREGGSVTERHLLFALAKKIIQKHGKGKSTAEFLKNSLKINLSAKIEEYLLDTDNEMYEYDLLGALKSEFAEKFYIDADRECPDVRDVLALSKEVGGISAYAYLGDVSQSVTGDKKAQSFEDGYLELLFDTLDNLGFNAVTYMPSRNTSEQLARIRSLCRKYRLFEISGEDINSPRQSFICYAQRRPEFAHLTDAATALIGHQRAVYKDVSHSMFSDETVARIPDIEERVAYYKQLVLN